MNKNELIKKCIISKDAAETYPFKDYPDMTVMRHKSNNKWFGLIFELDGKLCINLKCEPWEGAILRDEYPYITPAWHMNKAHWITVDVNSADMEVLEGIIKTSFELTK